MERGLSISLIHLGMAINDSVQKLFYAAYGMISRGAKIAKKPLFFFYLCDKND